MSANGVPSGGRGGGRGGKSGCRGPLQREVQVSKSMAKLLRHGAEKEGLQLDASGYANLQDVLNNRNVRSLKVTFAEVRQIVEENDKQRFSLVPAKDVENGGSVNGQPTVPSEDPKDWLIRANQGHSLKIESESLLQPITRDNAPETAIHGTTHAAWPLIVATGGLKPMSRTHVHFASGLPATFKSVVDLDSDNTAAPPVISGMRNSSTVLIFLDVEKAMEAGLKLWRSDNGVILTEGNEQGVVPVEFLKRVEDRTGAGVLMEDGKVVKEAPESWAKGKRKG